MNKTSRRCYQKVQCGAVLLLALVFTLLLAIIAGSVMQDATMQWHMAGNDQFQAEAFHRAQGVITELSLEPANFPLQGEVGFTNCPATDLGADCELSLLPTPKFAEGDPGAAVTYRSVRQDPLLLQGFPIRESQYTASSSASFDAALFELDVRVDGSAQQIGSAHLVQGMAVRVSAFR